SNFPNFSFKPFKAFLNQFQTHNTTTTFFIKEKLKSLRKQFIIGSLLAKLPCHHSSTLASLKRLARQDFTSFMEIFIPSFKIQS
ncbi:MAG: hypothetical protein ACUVTB_07895, partial [Candidatus Bathycorpusculaceae bacterium]